MLKIKSTFKNNSKIPARYAIDGLGISPPLIINNIPSDARNLHIAVFDPDANNFVHLNHIVPLTSSIPEGFFLDYIPPDPPSGVHRYMFRVIATGVYGRRLDEGLLVGTYRSKKK